MGEGGFGISLVGKKPVYPKVKSTGFYPKNFLSKFENYIIPSENHVNIF